MIPREKKNNKVAKSTWLPILLLIYFAGMACYYGPTLVAEGETLRLVIVSVLELGVIILLRWFLKKKEA